QDCTDATTGGQVTGRDAAAVTETAIAGERPVPGDGPRGDHDAGVPLRSAGKGPTVPRFERERVRRRHLQSPGKELAVATVNASPGAGAALVPCRQAASVTGGPDARKRAERHKAQVRHVQSVTQPA